MAIFSQMWFQVGLGQPHRELDWCLWFGMAPESTLRSAAGAKHSHPDYRRIARLELERRAKLEE